MDEMAAALQADGEATGRVMVGSTALLMEYEMGDLLRECRYRYPGVQVSPKVMTATRVESAVAAGEVDIGLSLTLDPEDEVPRVPGVCRQTLFKIPFVAIGGASANPGPPPPDADRVLVVDPDCVSHEVLLRHLKTERGVRPSVLEAGSTRSAINLARAGLGVAMVPRLAVEQDLGRDALVAERLPSADAYVQALWVGTTWLPPAVSAFLEMLRKAPGAAARQPAFA
ncbi:substrate-binding domain-containing protein [Streptomyces sp. NPDC007818]|uniref:substrate-binding domain-containing protein n=1 Tax=Streptomyces sp. NPDC007818 TaxID=3364780 RepID=UPI0036C98B55